MPDQLHQYCIAYLSSDSIDDKDVIANCAAIYLIDGQPIDFPDTLKASATIGTLSDEDMLRRDNAKGQDSIHFQQLRAFDLANSILRNRGQYASGRKLKIAVVGGGFAGLTAVLTLLHNPSSDVTVTLFEHHRKLMPRFSGAFGRRVFPYHHLRVPAQVMQMNDDEACWSCPVRGESSLESGGIDEVLPWTPGPIEKVAKQVADFANKKFKDYEEQERLFVRLQTKVRGVSPAEGRVSHINWVDYREVNDDHEETTSLAALDDENTDGETFDIVILAPGSGRDAVSLLGQSNAEYWNPGRLENAEPIAGRHEIAIIGSGNTAASEIFNFLLPDFGFARFLECLHGLKDDAKLGAGLKQIMDADFNGEWNQKSFDVRLTEPAWDALGSELKKRLVREGILASPNLVGITVFVRTSMPLFKEMNGINKFLVLLLARLGYVDIRNVYEEYKLERASASSTYLITLDKRTPVMTLPNGKKVSPRNGDDWTQICNCSGVERTYQDVFVGTKIAGTPQHMIFGVTGREKKAWSLRELLVEKQGILKSMSMAAPAKTVEEVIGDQAG